MDDVAHVLDGWSQDELRVQRCEACEAQQFPPRAVCLICRSGRLGWNTIAPRGAIHTFTIVYRAPTATWKRRVPYAVALVDLAPGVRMMMNVETHDLDALAIGAGVTIGFTVNDDDPQRRPIARISNQVAEGVA